jgi:hypothetical protein
LTKTDDLQLEFRRTFASYLASFLPFEYENKTYRLINSYIALPWRRCDVCGNYPIKYVSVIRSSDGRELHVGRNCIDSLTSRKASDWFKKFWIKLDNLARNRKYIDGLDSILTAYRNSELPFEILEKDLAQLQTTFRRICNGLNPNRNQEKLAERYIRKCDCS